jgi:4-amino-4-deoxy-L-arabinose transferase-like glycosyltransferase
MPGLDNRGGRQISLAVLCTAAFALRVYVILHMRQMGLFADMQEYHDRAVHLLQTGTLTPDAFRVPLFPIFIAGIYRLFGPELIAVRMAQAVLSTITIALTYAAARRIVSPRGALFAAFIVAFYPALILYSAYTMAETLFTFLALLAIVLWLSPRWLADRRSKSVTAGAKTEGWWTAILAGLVVGAATLTRSAGLAVLAGMLLAEIDAIMRRRLLFQRLVVTRAVLLIAGFAVVLAPWMLRNYEIYRRVIPTDTSSGFNALLGNYPGATGRHPGIPAVEAAAKEYWTTARNDLERSDIGLRVAQEYAVEHPGRALRLAFRKVAYLFGVEGREHAWGYSYHLQGRRTANVVWVWGLAIVVSFPLLMTLGSIGLWRPGITQSGAGVLIVCTLAAVTAIHIASFGDTRFHLPWVPLIAILAARAFAALDAGPWTLARQTLLAMWLVAFALVWKDQAAELMAVLPKLAESPVPLGLPY